MPTLPPALRSIARAVRHRGAWQLVKLGVRVLGSEGTAGVRRRLAAHHAAAPRLTDPGADPKSFAIITTPHVQHIARHLAAILTEQGFSAQITTDPAGADEFAHVLVLTPQMFDRLPPNFIAFQMEQSVSDRWLTGQYLKLLKSARAVLDYSVDNLTVLRDGGIPLDRLFHVPLDVDPGLLRPDPGPRRGVLFYGDVSSPRRQRILSRLATVIPELRIETALFGPALDQALREAAVVLNVHFYEGALLETARLTQAMSHGAAVVSEAGADQDRHGDLAGIVDFAAAGDVEDLIRRVRRLLDDPAHAAARFATIDAYAARPDNRLRAGFLRFLLAEGLISPAAFDQAVPQWQPPAPAPARLCLTLPETPARLAAFAAQAPAADFTAWAGLRGRPGWRGAALSHARLCRDLLRQGIHEAIICEDDVVFPDGFQTRFAAIRDHLDAADDWEMFSGYVADAGAGWTVRPRCRAGDIDLIDSDRAVSMVFNILRRPVLEHLAAWDPGNDDPFTNTIDRWLERRKTRVVIALPFLVDHAEGGSTLRADSVTHYRRLADASAGRLSRAAGL